MPAVAAALVGPRLRLLARVASATLAACGGNVIVDGSSGDVQVRPASDVEHAYAEKVRFRAKRQVPPRPDGAPNRVPA